MSAPGTSPGTSPEAPPSSQAPPRRAWRSGLAWVTLLTALALGLAADLSSKSLAFAHVAGSRSSGAAGPVVIRREQVLSLPPDHINSLIPRHAPMEIVPNLLELRLVLNPGAVFGIGPGKQAFFIAFTVVALGFGFWMFGAWTTARDRWAHAAIGVVLAGGLGNLYDRLVYGCVRDFLHPLPGVTLPFGWSWPSGDRQAWPYVSNVADALLLVGIVVLLVKLWRNEPGKRSEEPAEVTPRAAEPLPPL